MINVNFAPACLVALLLAVACGDQGAELSQADSLLRSLQAAESAEKQLALLGSLSAREVLPRGGTTARAIVRRFLAGPDRVVAAKAGELLAEWGDREATGPLLRLLTDEDWTIRFSAAASLTRLADPTSEQSLIAAGTDPVAPVRAQVSTALGALPPSPAGVAALRRATADGDPGVRSAAVAALGTLGSREDAPRALSLLGDADPGVVVSAIGALSALSHAPAVVLLRTLLDDESGRVRSAAASALGELGDQAAWDELVRRVRDDETDVAVAALGALARLWNFVDLDADPGTSDSRAHGPVHDHVRARPNLLLAALGSPDPRTRAYGVHLIGGGHDALKLDLVSLLSDSDPAVRGETARALAKLQVTTAFAELRRLAREDPDPQVRRAAAEAVAGRYSSRAAER